MKPASHLSFVFLALGAGLALTGGCSGQAFEPADGNLGLGGGAALGGSASTGGAPTGGNPSLGGGPGAGGLVGSGGSGGSPGAMGGSSQGGSGGATMTGGAPGTGGAPPGDACEKPSDCAACAFPSAPSDPTQCYCPTCPSEALTLEQCEHNRQAWSQQGCEGNVCPAVACVEPPPVTCDNGQCAFEAPVGRECSFDKDCTVCPYPSAPQTPEECPCPGCGEAMSVERCDTNAEAWHKQGCALLPRVCPGIACLPVEQGAYCSFEGRCSLGAGPTPVD